MQSHAQSLAGPLVALFIAYKNPDEILVEYKKKMVEPIHKAQKYQLAQDKVDTLRAMYAQGQEYVKHHASEINELLGQDMLELKRPALKALHSLRWHMAKLNQEEYLIAHSLITEEMSEYADFIHNIVQQQLYERVINSIITGEGHPELANLDPFGNTVAEA